MKKQIENYIRAGYSGLYIVSTEEQRVQIELSAVAETTGFKLFAWSYTQGLVSCEKEPSSYVDTQEPVACLKESTKLPEKSILIMRDLNLFLTHPDPMLSRAIKDSLAVGKKTNRVLVIIGCQLQLPVELQKEITAINFDLPGRDELRTILHSVAQSACCKVRKETEEPLLDAASGLTTTEAENIFALSFAECREFSPTVVSREKTSEIAKGGLLEVVNSKLTLKDVGGLEVLIRDLTEKRGLFSRAAEKYGLDSPRGLLLIGQPGTGKSLVAKVTASIFGIPLLRLDLGKLFGSLMGQTESNWRAAHAIARAISPCILWLDDCDFSGAKSSGQTDSGITARLFKSLLVDMQENSKGIFYVLTANDIDTMPDPLIRRLDVYCVDLPNQSERESILKIHIDKRGRKPAKYDVQKLAEKLDGYSGAEIEQVWLKAMNLSFVADREPANADIETAIARIAPTSRTMKDAIEQRRQRLQGRAINASAPEIKAVQGGRKLAA